MRHRCAIIVIISLIIMCMFLYLTKKNCCKSNLLWWIFQSFAIYIFLVLKIIMYQSAQCPQLKVIRRDLGTFIVFESGFRNRLSRHQYLYNINLFMQSIQNKQLSIRTLFRSSTWQTVQLLLFLLYIVIAISEQ